MCGDAYPVKGYDTKRPMRCGYFVEPQYYSFGGTKKDDEEGRGSCFVNPDISCICCNMEDLVSSDDIKNNFNVGGRVPLPLCNFCFSLNIEPPSTNAATIFLKKDAGTSIQEEKVGSSCI